VGNEKIYTEMKELIDLLEQYVKENAVIIQSVSIEGRVASFCIDLPLQGNQISRIVDILNIQIKQNNHDASFSIKTI
jgi:hypothetical protein